MNIFDSQVEKSQQNGSRFLFIPGKYQSEGQIVDTASEYFCQCHCYADRTVGIVALSHIQKTGQTADGSQIQVVEAVFAAAQSENDCVFRCLFYKFCKIRTGTAFAVTAAYQENVFQRTVLYCIYNFVSNGQNCIAAKTGSQCGAAVDAGKLFIFGESAKLKRFFDHRCEILIALLICGNGYHTGITYNTGGKYPVCVAFLGRHQAVGCIQDWSGQIIKFRTLIVPCSTVISLQMSVFLQFGISVAGEHLTMCVDIDTLAFCLFQQHLQVMKIMAGYHNERSFFHFHAYGSGNRCTVGSGIGTIQQFHAQQIDPANFQYFRQKLFHGHIFANVEQCFVNPFNYFIIRITQYHGMICIGSHTAYTEQNQRFERADIFLGIPELIHIVIFFSSAGICAVFTGSGKKLLLCLNGIIETGQCSFIKIHIGQCGKQSFHHQSAGLCDGGYILRICATCQADQGAGQFVLQQGNVTFFTTDTCSTGTSGAS